MLTMSNKETRQPETWMEFPLSLAVSRWFLYLSSIFSGKLQVSRRSCNQSREIWSQKILIGAINILKIFLSHRMLA